MPDGHQPIGLPEKKHNRIVWAKTIIDACLEGFLGLRKSDYDVISLIWDQVYLLKITLKLILIKSLYFLFFRVNDMKYVHTDIYIYTYIYTYIFMHIYIYIYI